MGLRCGIVGLPNVGKSTLFNALTHAGVSAENYPFCTVEPNTGLVPLADPRLDQIASIVKPDRVVPATMEFVDIAGLVKGASKGEGLGNRFLAHIRETDAIAQVVRCFDDENVSHVAARIDPRSDIEVVNTELLLADLETVERAIAKVDKLGKSGDKEALARKTFLTRLYQHLNGGEPVRTMEIGVGHGEEVRNLFLLTMKPVLYIANVDESGVSGSDYVDIVRTIAGAETAPVVVICSKLEAELGELAPNERTEFLQDYGIVEPGIDRLARAGFGLLRLQTFFTTTGSKEVRAWTVPAGISAQKAAGVVHTDFEKGFIRAEVISCDDFIACNGEHGAREAGKLRLEGKEYRVQDGDVIKVRFNPVAA